MALGHTGMAGKALTAQDVCSDGAVLDVRLRAVTMDGGCISPEIDDIVQHGGLFQKLHVDGQFAVLAYNPQATVGHLPRMH